MKLHSSFLPITVAVLSLMASHLASAQLPATSDNGVNDRSSRLLMSEGVLKVNGVLFIVTAGIAKRIDLADGQMATMDGLVKAIPANATLPGGVPQATVSSASNSAAPVPAPTNTGTDPTKTTATGATNTPQADRNRAVADPTPGSSTPSTK